MQGRLTLRNCCSWGLVLALALVCGLWSSGQAGASGSSNGVARPDPDNDSGYWSSIALDANGKPVVSYIRNQSDGPTMVIGDLHILHCGDPSCSSGNSISIPDGNYANGRTSLVLDATGNPVVAYTASTSSVSNISLKVLHCGDPECTTGNTIALPEGGLARGNSPSLELDDNGNPVVSYDGSNLLHCGTQDCMSGNVITTFDAAGADGTALAFDASGNPIIAYATSQGLKVVHCDDPNCSGLGEVVSVLNSDHYPYLSSFDLDAAGYPVISYWNQNANELRLVHCADVNCSSQNSEEPVQAAGPWSSVGLDNSGNPYLAATTLTNSTLQLFHCSDPNCGAMQTVRTLDTNRRDVFTGISMDGAGLPVISHQGGPKGQITVIHCGSEDCDADFDNDGCGDHFERETAVDSELYGGRRNPKDPNDYFNPTHDGENRVDDILAVVDAYFMDDADGNPGLPPYAPGYNPDTDRTLIGPLAWNLGPPNGLQRVDDILNQLNQYFHDCA